jgi:hypothetical protein
MHISKRIRTPKRAHFSLAYTHCNLPIFAPYETGSVKIFYTAKASSLVFSHFLLVLVLHYLLVHGTFPFLSIRSSHAFQFGVLMLSKSK